MELKPDNYDAFWRNGWTVVERVFTNDETDHICDLATRLCDEDLAAAKENAYLADRAEDGTQQSRKMAQPFLRHEAFRRFATDARLRGLIEQFIGAPPRMVADQIFMKPPRFGSAKPYHQDNAYFLLYPDDEAITAWIALDDVDASNGCLRYIEGSHRGPILKHLHDPDEPHNRSPAQDDIDLSREVLACVGKGGVVFHHCKTLHTSHRNESDRWRRGYATHWASAAVKSENDTISNAYFNRHAELYDETVGAAGDG